MSNLHRFVDPSQKPHRIPLSDGDWIEIKPELHVADQKLLAHSGVTAIVVDGRLFQPIDWAIYELRRVEVWLLEWSLKTKDDKPMPLTRASIEQLKPASFEEINAAIEAYVKAQEAAKKGPAPTAPAATSSGASTSTESLSTTGA